MKKTRFIRLIVAVLAVMMVLGVSSTAFADIGYVDSSVSSKANWYASVARSKSVAMGAAVFNSKDYNTNTEGYIKYSDGSRAKINWIVQQKRSTDTSYLSAFDTAQEVSGRVRVERSDWRTYFGTKDGKYRLKMYNPNSKMVMVKASYSPG